MPFENPEQTRIRELLVSSISTMCLGSLDFRSEVLIEGLLGITIDKKDVYLVNIKELVQASASLAAPQPSSSQVDSAMPALRAALQPQPPPQPETKKRKGKRKAQPHKLRVDTINGEGDRGKKFKPEINHNAVLNPEAFQHADEATLGSLGSLAIKMEPQDDCSSSADAWPHSSSPAFPDLDSSCDPSADSSLMRSVVFDDSDVQNGSLFNENNNNLTFPDKSNDSIMVHGSRLRQMPLKRVIRKHNPELIADLVNKIKAGEISLADAARKYNIPRPTLSDKVRGRTPITKCRQNRKVLDAEEEEALVVWCLEQASGGSVPSQAKFMDQVNLYLAKHGRNSLANSKEWLKSFIRRHTELSNSGITFESS